MNDRAQVLRLGIIRDTIQLDTEIKEGKQGLAIFDNDNRYRYVLLRRLHNEGSILHFCMLNPSIADQDQDDPTIRRCMGFARRWGYALLVVTNIFAFRAGDPRMMAVESDPVGRLNDHYIQANVEACHRTIVAWGDWGLVKAATYRGSRGPEVLDLLSLHGLTIYHLGLTQKGQPKHPLYLRADTEPVEWKWDR